MKAVVIRPFIDKNTGAPYNRDSIYETDDPKRMKELQSKGFLLSTKEEKPKQEKEQDDDETGKQGSREQGDES